MIYLRLLVAGSLLLIITSCFAKRDIVPAVSTADAVAIMLPTDGVYRGTTYLGSGRMVATKIIQATFGRVLSSEIIETTNLKDALAYCQNKGIRFLIQPLILRWEDWAMNWSGKRDFIKIEVVLVNPKNAAPLNSVWYEDSSSAWWQFENRPPEDMLDESFASAIHILLDGRR